MKRGLPSKTEKLFLFVGTPKLFAGVAIFKLVSPRLKTLATPLRTGRISFLVRASAFSYSFRLDGSGSLAVTQIP
jgi:hypothetical protein